MTRADSPSRRSRTNPVSSDSAGREEQACRWCGSLTNRGFSHCPNCHRDQGRFSGIFGTTANTIGVLGVVVTFCQLALAWNESRQATHSAELATQAREASESLLQEISTLQIELGGLKREARDSAQEAKNAYLQVSEVRARLDSLTRAARLEIEEAQTELDVSKERYEQLENELAFLPPQLTVSEPRVVYRQSKLLGIKMNLPQSEVREVKRPNPDYRAKQDELDLAATTVGAAEQKLTELLEESRSSVNEGGGS